MGNVEAGEGEGVGVQGGGEVGKRDSQGERAVRTRWWVSCGETVTSRKIRVV